MSKEIKNRVLRPVVEIYLKGVETEIGSITMNYSSGTPNIFTATQSHWNDPPNSIKRVTDNSEFGITYYFSIHHNILFIGRGDFIELVNSCQKSSFQFCLTFED